MEIAARRARHERSDDHPARTVSRRPSGGPLRRRAIAFTEQLRECLQPQGGGHKRNLLIGAVAASGLLVLLSIIAIALYIGTRNTQPVVAPRTREGSHREHTYCCW